MKTVTDIYMDARHRQEPYAISARNGGSVSIFRYRTIEEAATALDSLVAQGYELPADEEVDIRRPIR